MTVSRRRTIQALGAATGLTAASGTVFARGEHEDDDRESEDDTDDGREERDADEADDDADAPPVTAIRVAHFSPDAPNVDVFVDGTRVVADLEYDDVTPYFEIESGTYTVTITAAGDPDAVAFESEVWLGSAFYTIAAIGEFGDETFSLRVLRDAGSALVRVTHASPDAPPVDVTANGAVLADGISFGETTNYVAVPAVAYGVDVTPADADDPVASFELELEQGVAYSAYAIGLLEPGDLEDRAFTLRAVVDGPTAGGEGDE